MQQIYFLDMIKKLMRSSFSAHDAGPGARWGNFFISNRVPEKSGKTINLLTEYWVLGNEYHHSIFIFFGRGK